MAELLLLPIFPLGTVLFPGVVLPLHIFEERYKTMIRRCLARDAQLGIVLIREGWEVGAAATPFEVGTLARIVRSDALADGKMNIAVVGQSRFQITQLVGGEPYQQATVELLEEGAGEIEETLLQNIRVQFADYVQTLRQLAKGDDRSLRVPNSAVDLSYVVAANMQIGARERQLLLEATVGRRLEHESEILRRELTLLRRLGAIENRQLRSPTEVPLN